jgi:PIN domain nuclease of toxin-antitoxin system
VNAILDTHAFLWMVTDDRRLSEAARAAIADGANQVFLSAASMWEIVLKTGAGKLHLRGGPARFLEREIRRNRLAPLPIQSAHVLRVSSLPTIHKDPFDRLLIAQAQVENLPLITADPAITRYPVQVIW